jgi:hypothetical protein
MCSAMCKVCHLHPTTHTHTHTHTHAVAFKIPNVPVDQDPGRIFSHWNEETKVSMCVCVCMCV